MEIHDFINGINAIDKDWENFVKSKSSFIKSINNKFWEIRLSKASDIAIKFLDKNKGEFISIKLEFLDKDSRFLSDVKLKALKSEFSKEQFLKLVDHLANPKYCMSDKKMFKLANQYEYNYT